MHTPTLLTNVLIRDVCQVIEFRIILLTSYMQAKHIFLQTQITVCNEVVNQQFIIGNFLHSKIS